MYNGPSPKSINNTYPEHTYELITCLVNGEQKRSIMNRYLIKYGYTRETYIEQFPDAPLMSIAARDNYKKVALSENGKRIRSKTMTNLNLTDENFQISRKKSVRSFLDSDNSLEYRTMLSEKAKLQHHNGLANSVRQYFKERFNGSVDQLARSERMKTKNILNFPGAKVKSKDTYLRNVNIGIHNKTSMFKKKKYENTELFYQSSYELDFLMVCSSYGILDRISNGIGFSDEQYPYNYYICDYILDGKYVIEIKSWYIERLQENKYPNNLILKKELVNRAGYSFIYIKDKNYTQFYNIINPPLV